MLTASIQLQGQAAIPSAQALCLSAEPTTSEVAVSAATDVTSEVVVSAAIDTTPEVAKPWFSQSRSAAMDDGSQQFEFVVVQRLPGGDQNQPQKLGLRVQEYPGGALQMQVKKVIPGHLVAIENARLAQVPALCSQQLRRGDIIECVNKRRDLDGMIDELCHPTGPICMAIQMGPVG